MIMAGRGRRLGDLGDLPKQVGAKTSSPDEPFYDLTTLTQKIDEIDVTNPKQTELSIIQNSFKRLCTSKNDIKSILTDFHKKALSDASFSDKLLTALSPIYHFEDGEVNLKNELLTLLQNDFQSKDKLKEEDKKSFLNSIMLLGSAFNRIKISGTPVAVLGVALLEYFEILLKGEEEELKVLAAQVFINGKNFIGNSTLEEAFNRLQCNLRNSLVTKNLSSSSKYWILLCIDFISNGLKPLTGFLRDYFVENLGNAYTQLEPLVNVTNNQLNNSLSSPESIKSQGSPSSKSSSSVKSTKKDLSTRFSDMSVTTSNDVKRKGEPSFGKQKEGQGWKDGKFGGGHKEKSQGRSKNISGHDDRFDKEEDHYGVQLPRRPKPESAKSKFGEFKGNKKDMNKEVKPKADFDKKSEPTEGLTEEKWD